jgi:hypothetical protein
MTKKFFDTIKMKNNQLTLNLTLIGYIDEGNFILFSPALDLYAYGENEDDAFKAFDETISLYLDHVKEENSLDEDLKKLGWKKDALFKKRYTPPKYDPRDIMSEKGVNSFQIVDKSLQLQS